MRRIPTGALLAIGATVPVQAGQPPYANLTFTFPATGTGLAYASGCASEYWSYTAATSAQASRNRFTRTDSYTYDGSSIRVDTFYKDATTLCDGKPRVASSPAIPLSTRTTTVRMGNPTTKVYTATQFSGRLLPSPSCSIKPADCDPLWADYSRSLGASAPQITPGPRIPPCWNSSFASSEAAFQSSFYGCGKCTIFGDGVQLVYFPVPTTVSRDMCATTPSANLTYYGSGAVITAYAGTRDSSGMNQSSSGQKTAVVNGHTFTSGTAYISIASVWASDRCSSTHGAVVTDAILAMPSESVLSLRYTQNHFEYYFDQTVTQTGYPVSYADFNEPVPYSAWNGQSTCRAADDGYSCQTIYEGMYRPQLAIPPGIRDLSPDFKGCAFWYRGLYDPPLALTEAASEDTPTPPGHQGGYKATAMESTTAVATGPVLMSESQRSHPGSRPQNQIAKPTSTSQDVRHGSDQHKSGPFGSSSNGINDGFSNGNDSQDGSDSEGDSTQGFAEQSSAHGRLPNHQQEDAHVTQSEGFPHAPSVMASSSPHRILDGDGSIGNTGPFGDGGKPSQSLIEETYTKPGLHQSAAIPTYGGMGSSRHGNEATADSQASNRNHIGGVVPSGTAESQSRIPVDGAVPETAIETGAPPASHISNADARPSGDVQHDGNAQGPMPTLTGTGSGTAGPEEQHSGSMSTFLTGTAGQSSASASAATTTSNGGALDQPTQQSEKLTNSINEDATNVPLTPNPISSMIELPPTGQITAASTLSRSSSMSSRIAPSTQFLLSTIAVAVLFQMVQTAG